MTESLAPPDMAAARGSIANFIHAILNASPNGERVIVQYFPSGDWFVGKPADASELYEALRLIEDHETAAPCMTSEEAANRTLQEMREIARAAIEGRHE
jgi:hypothetical protein